MAATKAVVNISSLQGAANAIRRKGVSGTFKPSEMEAAIDSIPSGITPSGTYAVSGGGTYDISSYEYVDVRYILIIIQGTSHLKVATGSRGAIESLILTTYRQYNTAWEEGNIVAIYDPRS